ncbi:hypothetical protein VJ923_10535 [Adlercreutzia sp. R25]|uniref:Uncharacterized protein n=1 Tax=Adlercreutzia shanghongiae TaxID=3111773 RepID=A0ABU6J1D4_9ACTN|nr:MULTISPECIES: hypothetical protein [unclassified Adlercreutzia]MEC4273596.1 hypothetical protein [Adlercreutzia sp. R25]MEC4295922.1 hypothetical protein [Adlercreutzia sp. R22]
MAYQLQGSGASAEDTLELLAFDDEFDPLAVDNSEIDQEWMDDENPYDTIDYPTMRNMPETVHHDPVYSPERQGSVTAALQALIVRNPNRRPVLLGIVGLCENGCASSVISEKVEQWQRDNWSVYAPMTLCRMLERAGALVLEMPETAEEQESAEEGVAYLEIKEAVDPVWRATPEALALREEYLSGKHFRSIVMESDESRYAEVYEAVMEALAEAPRKLAAIEELTDQMDITKSPRRFGQHFIDVLETTDCVIWGDGAWNLTELGRAMLAELKDRKEA